MACYHGHSELNLLLDLPLDVGVTLRAILFRSHAMTKVTDALTLTNTPVFICDFTPPRGAELALLDGASQLQKAHFISIAYNPGKLVRLDSVTTAYQLQQRFGRDVIFNLSPRDMNKIALESRLLGASSLGLENVLVVQGDPIAEREAVTEVSDYRATSLISAVRRLNDGLDYRDGKLRSACDFCVGATIDPTRQLDQEVSLAHRKVEAGAQYFVTQPVFDAEQVKAIRSAYRTAAGSELDVPVFWGIQLLSKDGILFSGIPESIRHDIEQGHDGVEIALEAFESLKAAGERAFYLVAPILKGGARDYATASRFLDQLS
jgi:5,10-methylenetetrahydrofolate reductase